MAFYGDNLASNILPPGAVVQAAALALRGSTQQDRHTTVPRLLNALESCGCWMRERRAASATGIEFCFDVQLRSVLELYGALVSAGIELARDSHAELTSLCMLRKHNPASSEVGRVLTVRLELSFLDQVEHCPVRPQTAALA